MNGLIYSAEPQFPQVMSGTWRPFERCRLQSVVGVFSCSYSFGKKEVFIDILSFYLLLLFTH